VSILGEAGYLPRDFTGLILSIRRDEMANVDYSRGRVQRLHSSTLVALGLFALSACKKTDDPPPAQPSYATQPPGTTPVQQAPGYGNPTQAAAPISANPGAVPATAGTLSQPGPLALPCQSDVQCLTHHCNIAAGKCAWPCQTDNDCMPGNRCIAPTCLPKLQ